jgi:hypothetical protein
VPAERSTPLNQLPHAIFCSISVDTSGIQMIPSLRSRHGDFMRFLKTSRRRFSIGRVIHVALDNYTIQKRPKVPTARQASALDSSVTQRCPGSTHSEVFFAKRRLLLDCRSLDYRFTDRGQPLHRQDNCDSKRIVGTAEPDRALTVIKPGNQARQRCFTLGWR